MANLLLHCGSHAVDRQGLEALPTPLPTDTWQPIPHHALLEGVEHALDTQGFKITNSAHGATHDGLRYFGLLEVTRGGERKDYAHVLGLRNSHDKRFSAGICTGSQVLVCDNLCFSGEIKVARKHTVNIFRDLPDLVSGAVGRLRSMWRAQDERIRSYKEKRITDVRAHDLTVRAMDEGIICSTRIPKVLSEWRTPVHDEFRPRSLWSWFNGVTESLKGALHVLPERSSKLFELCDQYVGLN